MFASARLQARFHGQVRADLLSLPPYTAAWSRPSTTTYSRPDVALAFFVSAREASAGAGSWICAKGGTRPKTPVSAVFPLSVLSGLDMKNLFGMDVRPKPVNGPLRIKALHAKRVFC